MEGIDTDRKMPGSSRGLCIALRVQGTGILLNGEECYEWNQVAYYAAL